MTEFASAGSDRFGAALDHKPSKAYSTLASNLADDLLRVDLQGYEAVCDVNLSPRYAIHDPRNLGFDFAAIIQPDDHG
jgi:hypothetical protein